MIDILVPCLGRPESIARLNQNHAETAGLESQLVFIVSPHDNGVISECISERMRFLVVDRQHVQGDYAKKMNLGYRETSGEWILLGAQDILFHAGWDTSALMCATVSGKRVIGTNDLGHPESFRRGRFSTHPLVARSYVDELGTIDGPGLVTEAYDHNWVDRELADTALARGEWHYCRESVVEHLHPLWKKGKQDATYEKGLKSYAADRKTYLRRRSLWRAVR